MSTTLQIPMNEETRIALEECFDDNQNMDARKFIFDNLKMACQDAKRSMRAGVTPTNQIQEDGTNKQVEVKLKELDLEKYTLQSNPNWLPESIEKDDNKPIELKLGDNTMKYLKHFGQLTLIRHEKFNEAQDAYLEQQKADMKNTMQPKQFEVWEKAQNTRRDERLKQVPTCLEEALWTSIWPQINMKLDQNDGKLFDEEYAEIYKPEDDKENPAKKPVPGK